MVENVRDILRSADSVEDPYETLQAELVRQFSPNVLEQLNNIVFAPELGGEAPSILMKKLLAYLPVGLLSKHLFVLRLSSDMHHLCFLYSLV